MRIVLITQNDIFYLPKALDYLLTNIPVGAEVVGAVVNDVSPFGKRETMAQKALKTYRIFGFWFFLYYGLSYLSRRLFTPDVVRVLNQHGVPIVPTEANLNSAGSLVSIKSFSPDLLISIAGNQIFRQPLIDLTKHGILNLHTALLPKYRGLMPSFWVLKNNEKYTGVSVFFVDKGIDTGPILVQKPIEIGDMSQEMLIRSTKRLGMEAVIEAIKKVQSGNYHLLPNEGELSSYYSFPTREDVIAFRHAGKRLFRWL